MGCYWGFLAKKKKDMMMVRATRELMENRFQDRTRRSKMSGAIATGLGRGAGARPCSMER